MGASLKGTYVLFGVAAHDISIVAVAAQQQHEDEINNITVAVTASGLLVVVANRSRVAITLCRKCGGPGSGQDGGDGEEFESCMMMMVV
jgi:hypothetical protein